MSPLVETLEFASSVKVLTVRAEAVKRTSGSPAGLEVAVRRPRIGRGGKPLRRTESAIGERQFQGDAVPFPHGLVDLAIMPLAVLVSGESMK